jgi:threonine dehydratase
VCLVGGGNNDITRTEEIKERSMLYEGLKHYFVIRFPQRPGAFREFINDVLGPNDDITVFQYNRKNSRESGPAVVGIELMHKDDYGGLIRRMDEHGLNYEKVNGHPMLFNLLV